MASFIGTREEFKRYIGPMLRNLVQQITRHYKKSIGKCEHCGSTTNLESAHKHGRERGELIDTILKEYTHNEMVTIDLKNFENKFKEEHQKIEETILILCRTCHTKYDTQITHMDKKEKKIIPISNETFQNTSVKIVENITKKTSSERKRPFTNNEIEKRLKSACELLSLETLEKMTTKEYSKKVFNLNFPLLKKVSIKSSLEERKKSVKDHLGHNRWTLKYTFERDGFLYIICSQWYPQQDSYVQKWFLENKA